MSALRYVVFAVVGVVVASVVFLMLNAIVSVSHEAGTGLIERWIIRATCDQYELHGTIRDSAGKPVPFAVVEISYLDLQLATRSGSDGTFTLKAAEPMCDRAPPTSVALLVTADQFRPKRQTLAFDAGEVEVRLDAREFRP